MTTKATAILSIKMALLGSVIYFLGRWGLLLGNMQISNAADWWYRLIIVATLVIGMLALKGKQQGYLNFEEGFKLGGLTTVFLAIFMSGVTWVYSSFVQPDYGEQYEQAYRAFHYKRMMEAYIAETWKRDTITQGAMDTIQAGLDKNINEFTGHLFTVAGQVQSTFMYTIFWGLLTSITVIVLARKSRT